MIPCVEGRTDRRPVGGPGLAVGSIIPAVWSFTLAAPARGLGSVWTTLMWQGICHLATGASASGTRSRPWARGEAAGNGPFPAVR